MGKQGRIPEDGEDERMKWHNSLQSSRGTINSFTRSCFVNCHFVLLRDTGGVGASPTNQEGGRNLNNLKRLPVYHRTHTTFTHTLMEVKFRAIGLWQETWAHRENPGWHVENMQTPEWIQTLDLLAEATVLTTAPKGRQNKYVFPQYLVFPHEPLLFSLLKIFTIRPAFIQGEDPQPVLKLFELWLQIISIQLKTQEIKS